MQVSKALFVFCALIAVVYLMGTAVWMIAAVFGAAELGSLAQISVAGILMLAGLFAGVFLVWRKMAKQEFIPLRTTAFRRQLPACSAASCSWVNSWSSQATQREPSS